MRRPRTRPLVRYLWLCATLCACSGGIDPHKLQPDARPSDGRALDAGPSCPGFAAPPVPTVSFVSEAGDWTLVLPQSARHTALSISGAKPGQAAAAADWDEPVGDVAGLVLSRSTTNVEPFDETQLVLEAIVGGEELKGATLFSSGTLARAPDGQPRAANALLEIHKGSTTALYRVRNVLYPRLLQLDITQFPNLPEAPGETGDGFVVAIGSSLRSANRAVIMAGVATRDSFLSRDTKTRVLAGDLANGTALGSRLAGPQTRCEPLAVPDLPGLHDVADAGIVGMADVVWVVRGGVAASEMRTRLHSSVVSLWNRARGAGLDLRMAVAPIGPGTGASLCQAKDCAGPFATEQELASCLQPCVLEPGGSDEATHGLETARRALISLLPRTAGRADKLRPGAQVAVLFASDVEDGGAAALFSGAVPSHPLSDGDRQKLDDYLRPLLDLLGGQPNPQNELPAGVSAAELAGSSAHALVPYPIIEAPTQACGKRLGLAYARAALYAGGTFATLCADKSDDDLPVELALIAEQLAARGGGVPLSRTAVSSSLAAAVNGQGIYRSTGHGFDYVVSAGALVYYRGDRTAGAEPDLWSRGATVAVGYLAW
jgi:hypothetical protein